MRKLHLVSTAAALLTLGVILWSGLGRRSADAPVGSHGWDTRSTSAAGLEGAAPLARLDVGVAASDRSRGGWYHLASGSRLTFDLGLAMRSTMQGHDGTQLESQEARIDGALEVTVVDRRSHELVTLWRVRNASVHYGAMGRTIPEAAELLRIGLERPVLVRMRDDGQTLGIRFDPDLELEHRGWVRSLVAAARCTLPAADVRGWQHEEDTTDGRRTFDYEWIPHSADWLGVRRTQCGGPDAGTDPGFVTHTDARGEYGFDAELGWLRVLRWHDATQIELVALQATARIDWSLRAHLAGFVSGVRGLPSPGWDLDWASAATTDAEKAALADHRELAQWRATLRGQSIESLIGSILELAGQTGRDSASFNALVEQLAWALRIDPSEVGKVVATALAVLDTPTAREALLAALGASQTPAGQDALMTLAERTDLPISARTSAARSLFQARSVTPEIVDRAIQLAGYDDRVARTNLLLVGAFGDRSPAASQWLLAGEAQAIASGETATWITAVANQATPEAEATLARYAETGEPHVRQTAVRGLGQSANPEHARRVLSAALADPDPTVRGEAARLALARSTTPTEVATRILEDHAAPVRLAALSGLGARWGDSSVDPLRAQVRAMMTDDPVEQVRNSATQLFTPATPPF